jgi:hypothetical protein
VPYRFLEVLGENSRTCEEIRQAKEGWICVPGGFWLS